MDGFPGFLCSGTGKARNSSGDMALTRIFIDFFPRMCVFLQYSTKCAKREVLPAILCRQAFGGKKQFFPVF